MSLSTFATMIFALGSVYGGLAATLIYFFKKQSSLTDAENQDELL